MALSGEAWNRNIMQALESKGWLFAAMILRPMQASIAGTVWQLLSSCFLSLVEKPGAALSLLQTRDSSLSLPQIQIILPSPPPPPLQLFFFWQEMRNQGGRRGREGGPLSVSSGESEGGGRCEPGEE